MAGVPALLLTYMMPSLRTMFHHWQRSGAGAVHRHCAVLSVVAGLRTAASRWLPDLCGCCVVLTALFCCKSSWLTEAFSAVLSGLCLFTPV